MKKIIGFTCIMLLFWGTFFFNNNIALADEDPINEDDLFSGETVVEENEVVKDDVAKELDEKRIAVTGEVSTSTNFTPYDYTYDWFAAGTENQYKLVNQITADFFCDIRLKGGIKSFLNVGVSYYPVGIETGFMEINSDISIKEFFIDTNWQNKVYFRTGKQVLKWGRSYFWNPTDLINVERKDFMNMDKSREGTYGIKVHIPSGAAKNAYFFIGMDNADQINGVSLAGKYEFLIGGTEMSLSGWLKENYNPVYGFDISSRLFDLDLRGEISLSAGDNAFTMDYDTLQLYKREGWVPRVSVGFTKYFDLGEEKNRISITGEFYYNYAGYEKNIFQKIQQAADPAAERDKFMSYVYEPYVNSKYYLAIFSSVSKFIIANATLNFNAMVNLVDSSAVLTTGISYHPTITDICIDFGLNGYLGDKYTEATIYGSRANAYFRTSISF